MRIQDEERREKIMRTAQALLHFNAVLPFGAEREKIMHELFPDIGADSFVHPSIYVNIADNVHIGCDVYINPYFKCMAAGNVYIKDGAQIAMGVSIVTNNHDFYDRAVITIQDIHIGRNTWIGAGAIILPSVTVGENAVVGAGSVVTHDVAANTVVAGNPARLIRTLEAEKLMAS